MSPYAGHFTAPTPPESPSPEPLPEGGIARLVAAVGRIRASDKTGYHNAISILGDGFIRPFEEPHGAGKHIVELAGKHRSASFSEIPLHLLDRLVKARSVYGLGFRQEFLIGEGGARVWYLEEGGSVAEAMRALVEQRRQGGFGVDDPLWDATPFIDFPDPAHPFKDWRWEREWRVPGGLKFAPDDVAFLFIPEELHAQARQFFVDAKVGNTGPSYLCPYIDPTWDRARILDALNNVPPAPPPGAGYEPYGGMMHDLHVHGVPGEI